MPIPPTSRVAHTGYLAAIKTQNGAAMSVGRISTFLDIYIERDLKEGTLTEKAASLAVVAGPEIS